MQAGKAWQEKARRAQSRTTRGGATRPSFAELRELLDAGKALRVLVPECDVIEAGLREAAKWVNRAETALERVNEEGPALLKELMQLKTRSDGLSVHLELITTVRLRRVSHLSLTLPIVFSTWHARHFDTLR